MALACGGSCAYHGFSKPAMFH